MTIRNFVKLFAAVAELADAQDSKSCEGNLMRVRFSPAALICSVKAKSGAAKSCARKSMSVRLRPAAPPVRGATDSPHQSKARCGAGKIPWAQARVGSNPIFGTSKCLSQNYHSVRIPSEGGFLPHPDPLFQGDGRIFFVFLLILQLYVELHFKVEFSYRSSYMYFLKCLAS